MANVGSITVPVIVEKIEQQTADRIASALERIADALEKPDRVYLDGSKLSESIIRAAARPGIPWREPPKEDQQKSAD